MNALQRDLKRLVPLVETLGASEAEADPHRQRLHIQPPVGWLNDPNGLCVYKGEYHVFFQYGPFDAHGGVKHWGHVRSKDLFHWERLPVMLYPDEPFDCHGAYSGSALVEDDVMYLYYTGNVKLPGDYDYINTGRNYNLCLAVSRDGETLASKQLLMSNCDYPANLSCHVRDPKAFAYDGKYYIVLGARTLDSRGEVLVLESSDKLHWKHINTLTTPQPFGYMWECPDLFCVEGQWYLMVSPQGIECQNVFGCGYFAVYGDWRTECRLGKFHELDAGFDYYAPQSFEDGCRRLLLAWMGMPDAPYGNESTAVHGWQHCMTVPRVITRGVDDTLLQNPVPELESLRSAELALADGESREVSPCFDLCAEPDGDFTFEAAHGIEFVYTQADRTCVLRFTDPAIADGRGGERRARLEVPCGSVRIVGDSSSLEIFLNGGAATFAVRYYPTAGPVNVRLSGAASKLYELKL